MTEQVDVAVIGSGPGGYVAAIRAAQLGLKTACIEKDPVLGGTCLNVGCIPSKALLHSSEMLYKINHQAASLGIELTKASPNFAKMMERKQKIVSSFNQGVAFLFKKNKILTFTGKASLTSPSTIEIISSSGKQSLQARSIILATGSEPIALPFLPFDEKQVVSSTGALALKEVPKKLVVIGAGIIGVELGSVYHRLGSEVVFVEFLDKICPTLDETISKQFLQILTKQGMSFHLSSKVTGAEKSKGGISLQVEQKVGGVIKLEADVVLVSIGRKPYTGGLGLEKVGIAVNPKGFIPIDGQFHTHVPNIFAIGDIVDGPMLAHKASEEGIACAEIIAGHHPIMDYISIPNVVYTSPEAAGVGFTEKEAKDLGLSVKVGSCSFKANSRARCTGEEEGLVKIIAEETSGKLLGIHIVGAHASELIAECAVALAQRLTAFELAAISHAHPTLAEAIKEAALAVEGRAIHF